MIRRAVLFICISLGSSLGWYLGSPGGLMGSYLVGVIGASVGLFIGRKLQCYLDGD